MCIQSKLAERQRKPTIITNLWNQKQYGGLQNWKVLQLELYRQTVEKWFQMLFKGIWGHSVQRNQTQLLLTSANPGTNMAAHESRIRLEVVVAQSIYLVETQFQILQKLLVTGFHGYSTQVN
jgi:hypothetical protein